MTWCGVPFECCRKGRGGFVLLRQEKMVGLLTLPRMTSSRFPCSPTRSPNDPTPSPGRAPLGPRTAVRPRAPCLDRRAALEPAPRDCWQTTPAHWARARGHDALAITLERHRRAPERDDDAPAAAPLSNVARVAARDTLRRRCTEVRERGWATMRARRGMPGVRCYRDIHDTATWVSAYGVPCHELLLSASIGRSLMLPMRSHRR